MLTKLTLKNFTVFAEADFEFAPGLNVIVGSNGAGKTHLLKLAYCALSVCYPGPRMPDVPGPSKTLLQSTVANKLLMVFKPDELGRLTRRFQRGVQRAEVSFTFASPVGKLDFSFNTKSKSEVGIQKAPSAWIEKLPVYLPTRELLTIYPGFVSLYETTHLEFDETWRDTCILLGAPIARGPREQTIKRLLAPLEEAMGGKIDLTDSGRFYLNRNGMQTEMHLVAEGLRKLAMIARLIATGSLLDKGYLFWDEPEANLNPKVIKVVARTIMELCRNGIQVFIATHSLFLLRELDILQQSSPAPILVRYIGLHPCENGVEVSQGATVSDIGAIDSLQEELSQVDRYDAVEGT